MNVNDGRTKSSGEMIPMMPMMSNDDDVKDDATSADDKSGVETTSFYNPSWDQSFVETFRRTSLGCYNKVYLT